MPPLQSQAKTGHPVSHRRGLPPPPKMTVLQHVATVIFITAMMFLWQWLMIPFANYQLCRAKDADPSRKPDIIHYPGGSTLKLRDYKLTQKSRDLDEEEVDISLIIPSYDEEVRLPIMLNKAIPFLDYWSKERELTYEVIVVDDGSKDATTNVALDASSRYNNVIKVLQLGENRGKGGAVRKGVKIANGKYILMVDGDGATDIRDLAKLFKAIQRIEADNIPSLGTNSGSMGVAIGSRAHLEKKSIATRAFYRTVLMRGFHFLVTILCTQRIRDTQCGFKLFTKNAARFLFGNLHLEGWAFDIELIYLAERLGIPMTEVAVNWEEVDGSKLIQTKLDVVRTSLYMARDMFILRVAYMFGIWGYKR